MCVSYVSSRSPVSYFVSCWCVDHLSLNHPLLYLSFILLPSSSPTPVFRPWNFPHNLFFSHIPPHTLFVSRHLLQMEFLFPPDRKASCYFANRNKAAQVRENRIKSPFILSHSLDPWQSNVVHGLSNGASPKKLVCKVEPHSPSQTTQL